MAAAGSCPACGGDTRVTCVLHDDRYGCPGEFPLRRCAMCGHRHLEDPTGIADPATLYTRFYPRAQLDASRWRKPADEPRLLRWWRGSLASAFRWVPRNVRVLDIGCGAGESLAWHRERGCDAEGVETDANVARIAEQFGFKVSVGMFRADDYAPASFDVVTADQVLEHLIDPVRTIEGIRRVLKPRGRLIVSTPNADSWGARLFGNRWIHWHAPYHRQFFTGESLRRVAQRAGFTIIGRRVVTNTAWLSYQWCHVLTYPQPDVASPFWDPRAGRTPASRWAIRFGHVPKLLGLNGLLCRLADALGHGDNTVWILEAA